MSKSSNKVGYGVLCLLATLGIQQPVIAAEWNSTARFQVETEHSDNVLNSPSVELDAIETRGRFRVSANRNTRPLDISVLLGADYTTFSGTDALEDEDDQTARFEAVYRTSPNTNFGLRATYDRRTYTGRIGDLGEFDDEQGTETEVNVDPDAGFVRGQTRADLIDIRPSINMQLSARTSFMGIVYYNESDYGDNELTNIFDFEDIDYVGEFKYQLSSQRNDTLSLTLAYTDFDSERQGGLANSERYPVKIEYTRPFSEQTYLTIFGGAIPIDFESDEFEDETVPMYGFIYGHAGKLSKTQFRVIQHVRPNSNGLLTEHRRAQLIYLRETTRDQSLGFNLFYTQIEDLGLAEQGGRKRDYLAVEPEYSWYFGRKLRLSIAYRYSTVDRNEVGIDDAVTNEFRARLIYRLW